MTATAYRLPVEVPAGETVRFEAVLERPVMERIALLQDDLDRVQLWAGSRELSPEMRAALQEIAERREGIAALRRSLLESERSRGSIVAEQQRIRDNLQAVPENSDLSRRYLDTLSQQEDRLTELASELEALRVELRESEEGLAGYVRSIAL